MLPPLSRRRVLGAAVSVLATGVVPRAEATPALRRARDPVHFVLVHGAWHGAWCWYKVVAALAAAGHDVTTIDLPSAGIDATPANTVTLAAQAARVIEVLDALPTPVVLVGHSAAGPVVSTVAEARPEKVAKLVYLTAYLLPAGSSLVAVTIEDTESLVTQNLVFRPDGTVFLKPEGIRATFYGLSDDADVALAGSLLKPVAFQAMTTRIAVGPSFERVRRFYIACRRDRAITHATQRAMYERVPCEKVFTLNADHSPFFSRPAALLRALAAIARA